MEKIIVRKKIINMPRSRSSAILFHIEDFDSLHEFIKHYGIQTIMQEIYLEKDTVDVKDNDLYKDYLKILSTGEDNESFVMMYKLHQKICATFDAHIHLYGLYEHIKIGDDFIVPWHYVGSKVYYGDTWWFTDEEIINDLTNLSVVDYRIKYKLY